MNKQNIKEKKRNFYWFTVRFFLFIMKLRK